MLEILLNRIQIMMNQSQSPTSLDLAPSLSKRRGKGTIGSQTHETDLVPAARTRQMQFLIKVQLRRTLISLPAPYPRAPSLALRAIHLVAAQPPLLCKGERGIAKSFYGTFGVYRGDGVAPISGNQLPLGQCQMWSFASSSSSHRCSSSSMRVLSHGSPGR